MKYSKAVFLIGSLLQRIHHNLYHKLGYIVKLIPACNFSDNVLYFQNRFIGEWLSLARALR
ncbi:MAG: hypothetical protein KAI59_02170, partial [Planctomycetes bacterium]|nr:hypothetical protein [Planctomycetota bacterium]